MFTLIIDRENSTVNLNGKEFIFRSLDKNNSGIVPTYVLHVNEEGLNIKITVPQCSTAVIDIPKHK